MELTESQLTDLVRINLADITSVDHPDAIDAFNAGKLIFDVSDKAKKLKVFVATHKLRDRIDYSKKLAIDDCLFPFERFWDRPVYLIHDRDHAASPGR